LKEDEEKKETRVTKMEKGIEYLVQMMNLQNLSQMPTITPEQQNNMYIPGNSYGKENIHSINANGNNMEVDMKQLNNNTSRN
jgi:hypothetical protein